DAEREEFVHAPERFGVRRDRGFGAVRRRVWTHDRLELLEHVELLEKLTPERIDALVGRRGWIERLHHLADRHLIEVDDLLANLGKVVALREPALAAPARIAPADHQDAELLLRAAVRARDVRRTDEDPRAEHELVHDGVNGRRRDVYSPAALPASLEAELFVAGHTSSTAAYRARRLGCGACGSRVSDGASGR